MNDDTIEKLRQRGVNIGEDVHIYNSYIDGGWGNMITIGNHVTITNASILAHDASMKKGIGKTKVKKVSIGDYVFVGYNSIILPGVAVGSRVVIGAGTVVAKDIPDNSVVIGNPMQIIDTYDNYMKRKQDEVEKSRIYKIKNSSRGGYVNENGTEISVNDGETIYVY